MGLALIMGVSLMYLVLVIQFGSFSAPIPVMMSLPLSLIGVVLGTSASTHGHSEPDEFDRGHHVDGSGGEKCDTLARRSTQTRGGRRYDREEALMYAGRKRLRPILMTTFALIAGMMPVAIGIGQGGEFYRPMAVGDYRGDHHLDLIDIAGCSNLLR